jgi:GAF domain-containing protein
MKPTSQKAKNIKNGESTPWYLALTQIFLSLLGVGGAVWHAFPSEIHAEHENYPVLDMVTIAWIGVSVIGILLPRISEVTFGEASLKLGEIKEGAEELEESLDDIANLAQNWSSSPMLYISLLEKSTTKERKGLLLRNYLRDRMGEAKVFLGDEPESDVRIALWIHNPETDRVDFLYSNEVRPSQPSWSPGEGLIGQAWLESRSFNEPDVRKVPGYKHTRSFDPPYLAVLCIPVKRGHDTIGMLTVDKSDSELFSNVAQDIAIGLAAQCTLAIDQYQKLA